MRTFPHLALPALAALLLAAPALAQGNAPAAEQDGSFNLTNRSGRAIERFYASPVQSRAWGENRLSGSLAEGADVAVRMPARGGCRTDMRIVFADGLTEEKRDVNTCIDRDVVIGTPARTGSLQRDASGRVTTPQGDPSFELVNEGRSAIRELYASPTTSDNWGEDRLGQDVVEAGDRMFIRLPEGPCAYDIRVVWANSRAEERRDVNLCNTSELSFR
ncbi:hypothetical protein ACFFMP_07045 [Pseudoroseomonas cervicalis]|uniref:Tat pathway signal sequence domain protein n=1 Tax=Pseudoroseomonas cervicalis ATCC 49957 TaxID=525371 RepID=D5RSR7_9PROT|nr:hypothetical protein [Pseudoroseomonas cervicalis]EFH09653.1 hypothetical protein HMPREF0731_4129 [Pseudoroseomonas cervicalis ATCC 49957]